MKRGRIITAYVLSPFAGAIYMLVLMWLLNGPMWDDPKGIVSVIVIFAIIGYLVEGLLGTPVLCFFRRRGHLSLPWFLLGGLVIGIVLWIFLMIYLFPIFIETLFSYKLMFGLLGCVAPALISTSAFWFIGWSSDNKALQLTAR
jgi:hypothetical protein